MHQATLRLFKAVQIEQRIDREPNQELLAATIPYGYVLDPAIEPDSHLLQCINDVVGLSGEQANAAFHKSWEKIRTASMEQLYVEQIIHYMTTYGFKSIGMYDPSTVYIPNEMLDLPQAEGDLVFTYIRGLTSDEILQEIIKLGNGVALSPQSLDDIMEVVVANIYKAGLIHRVKNHELIARLYDFFGLVPEDPVAFLRYVIYRLTSTTLVIKSNELLNQIKALGPEQQSLLDRLIEKAPSDLASIFYRFKPIFLALKAISRNKTFFNRLRKRAVSLHEPLPQDYLNSVTEQIKTNQLDLVVFAKKVDEAAVFRKVRLASSLVYRINAGKSIVYPVRNGTGWATDFQWPDELLGVTHKALDIVLGSLVENLRPNVQGKTCFIPANINYAVPSSEKQFAGPFPVGSYVSTPKDTVFGIHWFDTEKRTIDLDLSLLSAEGKVGWDAAYRNETALFSGDMTSAPRPQGATELFYVKNGIAPQLVLCNYFNFSSSDPVEAMIIVSQEAPPKLTRNYMVDVSKVVAKANIKVTRKETVLGLVVTVGGETRFYFGNVSVGCGITSRANDQTAHARTYLTDKFVHGLDLKSLLEEAGAKCVEDRSVLDDSREEDVIDLSPENLSKSSILSLFTSGD